VKEREKGLLGKPSQGKHHYFIKNKYKLCTIEKSAPGMFFREVQAERLNLRGCRSGRGCRNTERLQGGGDPRYALKGGLFE